MLIWMKREQLDELHAHAEYGGVRLADLQVEQLRNQEGFAGLMADMKKNGLQFALVLAVTEAGETSLRDGHHRYVASRLLDWDTVPVVFRNYEEGK